MKEEKKLSCHQADRFLLVSATLWQKYKPSILTTDCTKVYLIYMFPNHYFTLFSGGRQSGQRLVVFQFQISALLFPAFSLTKTSPRQFPRKKWKMLTKILSKMLRCIQFSFGESKTPWGRVLGNKWPQTSLVGPQNRVTGPVCIYGFRLALGHATCMINYDSLLI